MCIKLVTCKTSKEKECFGQNYLFKHIFIFSDFLHIEKLVTTVLKEIISVHLRVEYIGLVVKVLNKFRLSSALPAAPFRANSSHSLTKYSANVLR